MVRLVEQGSRWPGNITWSGGRKLAISALLSDLHAAGDPACETMDIGPNVGSTRVMHLSSDIFTCPKVVNRDNWLGKFTFFDSFAVEQEGTRVNITRQAEAGVSMTHGWGLPLKFICCMPHMESVAVELPSLSHMEEDEAAIAAVGGEAGRRHETFAMSHSERWRSRNHYYVLGVSCDFTPEVLRRAYRQISLRLHPDRGGTTEAFARAAEAYECLSSAECRRKFDKGDDVGSSLQSFAADIEKRYFPDRFPFHPFGDPHRGRRARSQARKQGGASAVSTTAAGATSSLLELRNEL